MTSERLYLYDTTLRDGQQTQGVDFSATEKTRIAEALDALGVDYVEGGWPGANPTDSEFFEHPPKLERATFTAFGMTKRAGRSAANDDVLAAVANSGAPAVCVVGKTHDFHVRTALGLTLNENREAIRDTLVHLTSLGRETLFDAEHFFDGYKANPDYALSCLDAAMEAGARWVVLCDTNGGALPAEVGEIVAAVCARIPGANVGIHAHNDTENAVANSLVAVDAGARQIQGALNGLGERCGNANLVSLIPTLALKEAYRNRYQIGVPENMLVKLTRISNMLDDILNRAPNRHAPYVGDAAFAHKAGLHASAIAKDPTTYEHVPPETVGNKRIIPMSNQAGSANLVRRLAESGIVIERSDKRLSQLLALVKEREDKGFSYDSAAASFEVLARGYLGLMPKYFTIDRFRVTVERRYNARQQLTTVSEAVVVVSIDGKRNISASESFGEGSGDDQGPVNALSRALAKDLGKYQSYIDDLSLVDFKVRILSSGTGAVTRVLIESSDGQGARWTTVGVSANIVDASFQALVDSINYKLIRDGAPAAV